MNKSQTSETDLKSFGRSIERIQQSDSERITIKSSLNESAVLHSIWQSNEWKLWLLWTSQSLKKWKKPNRASSDVYFISQEKMKRAETLISLLQAFIDTNYVDSDDILDCLWLDVEKYSERFRKWMYKIREQYFEEMNSNDDVELDEYVEKASKFCLKFIS